MKITIDPMPALRAAAVEKINDAFNRVASANLHRDQAYAQKRTWAATLDARLAPEAALHGVTVAALAQLILSKPDLAADREFKRQTLLKQVEAATTPTGLIVDFPN